MVRKESDCASRALTYKGKVIQRGKDGMVNLTDMWRAVGSPPNKTPSEWIRAAATRELERVLEENMGISHVLRRQPGRTGSTSGHPLFAIAYAKFLSPEFHAWANGVILERVEENDDPELGMIRARSRAITKFKRDGRSEQWIQGRLAGIDIRHKFTDVLKEHGIELPWQYALCTDAVYRSTLGGSSKELKVERELSPKDNLRDHLRTSELAAISLSEAIASEAIDEHELNGLSECREACSWSGGIVSSAIEQSKRTSPFRRLKAKA